MFDAANAQQLYSDLKASNSESAKKERFIQYLTRAFAHDDKAQLLISAITMGAEKIIVTFINSMNCLQKFTQKILDQSELRVAFEQWQRFLSLAYGRFDASADMFFVHTYLSVFAKLIAFAVLAKDEIITDAKLRQILKGTAFDALNVERFVEDDFFHWVAAEEHFSSLKPMFREITKQLMLYDLEEIDEDILKGVYQELIDLETRHALGEYYTPDWLCEEMIDQMSLSKTSKVLDPACGSGSFLRAVVAKIKQQNLRISADEIAENIVGIDIHPLSVLIAKTTLLLAMGPAVAKARRPVTLNVYLANSLLVPSGSADLFGTIFQIVVDNKICKMNVEGVLSPESFDRLIAFCDELVMRSSETIERGKFHRLLKSYLPERHAREMPQRLYAIYEAMKQARDRKRDSIWRFVIQNSYKPVFLMHGFDFVVGNPPWLTYSSIHNADYQKLLLALSDHYDVTPAHRANFPHLEIAAIFLAHATNYFLKPDGIVAFVLPRSFMSADQHENTRSGSVANLKLTAIWDLDKVQPLFRVPCCVLFGRYSPSEDGNSLPTSGLAGRAYSGRLPKAQMHRSDALKFYKHVSLQWFHSRLKGSKGRSRSAFTTTSLDTLIGSNAYEEYFTQGATIVPRNFFFVESRSPLNRVARRSTVNINTSAASEREAKAPWKSNILQGRSEGEFLFTTAISRNMLPFMLVDPQVIILPVKANDDGSNYQVLSSEEVLALGNRFASDWFLKAERLWATHRTERNAASNVTLSQYLDWQGKLSGQKVQSRYLTLYTSSSTDASAVVIDRASFDHPFIVDHKTYWCEMKTLQEAHYVSAYINSGYANLTIKDFQSRGLFGPRDIHKTILKLPFPRFNKSSNLHVELSACGAQCAKKAANHFKANVFSDLQARALGRARAEIRSYLEADIDLIDTLVQSISGSQSENLAKAKKRRRAKTGTLFDK